MQLTVFQAGGACWLAVHVRASTEVGHDGVSVTISSRYVIGVDDRRTIAVWRDTDLASEVLVRPEGRISRPSRTDSDAAGLSRGHLRGRLLELAAKCIADPGAVLRSGDAL